MQSLAKTKTNSITTPFMLSLFHSLCVLVATFMRTKFINRQLNAKISISVYLSTLYLISEYKIRFCQINITTLLPSPCVIYKNKMILVRKCQPNRIYLKGFFCCCELWKQILWSLMLAIRSFFFKYNPH